MSLPPDLRFRSATTADVPVIAEMRAAAGWSVHEWALHAVMGTSAGRCVVAVDKQDAIQAVGSGMCYGALGFIGNMIVAEGHRRRGIGSAVLDEVIAFLESRECRRFELYATSEGRPLYARHGFELTGTSALAKVPREAPLAADAAAIAEEGPESLDELAAYDAPRFGGDRSPLLELMLNDPERPMIVARSNGAVVGFGWIRAEAARIGPMVADTPVVAGALVRAAFERLPEADALTLNLPLGNGGGSDWLRGIGVPLDPWDGRMARGPEVPRREDTIYGHAVGALG